MNNAELRNAQIHVQSLKLGGKNAKIKNSEHLKYRNSVIDEIINKK